MVDGVCALGRASRSGHVSSAWRLETTTPATPWPGVAGDFSGLGIGHVTRHRNDRQRIKALESLKNRVLDLEIAQSDSARECAASFDQLVLIKRRLAIARVELAELVNACTVADDDETALIDSIDATFAPEAASVVADARAIGTRAEALMHQHLLRQSSSRLQSGSA